MARASPIFRKAALDRLASPDRLDERLELPIYPPLLLAVVVALAVGLALFAVWLAELP